MPLVQIERLKTELVPSRPTPTSMNILPKFLATVYLFQSRIVPEYE
jgi:hypothetical protein